jgi:AraC-like DNA-binding protein
VPFDSLTYSRTGESGATLAHGGGGTPSVLLCAVVDFAGPGGLLATRLLPEVVTLRKAAAQGTTIAALVAGLGEEAARAEPGSAALMSGLGTALALSILRDASTSVGGLADSAGALGDDRIRRSVLAMHAEPGRPWTVEGLAGTAGMSRSVFASTFAEALGQTPIQYLTRLRIERARELLRESHRSLSAIADELGYGSQEAFSRAFRRETGVTPGAARASAA